MRRDPDTTGIYIHFPYCIQKCHYCDFYSVGMDHVTPELEVSPAGPQRTTVPAEQLHSFYNSLREELEQRLRAPDQYKSLSSSPGRDDTGFRRFRRVNTIFFGGGTASLMPPELIEKILTLLRSEFEFTLDIEITIEGNPENFTADYLEGLHQLGVTRVNVGLQTFREDLLDSMNRYYDPGRYETVLGNLSAAAIDRIGGDLIYGFPGQSEEEFYADLDRTLAAGVNHLSIYSLTLEPNTAYAGHVRTGKMIAPGEELQERIFQHLPDNLEKRGLVQYEVSNFARPGFTCRHNLRYWWYESYLGLGPGAHGFNGLLRYGNSRSIANWQTNPAGATLQPHDPIQELPLVYLRLCDRVEASVFYDVLVTEGGMPEQVARRAAEVIESWQRAGFGNSIVPGISGRTNEVADSRATTVNARGANIRWNTAGLLQLDDRVLEMCEALEEALKAAAD